MKLGKYILGLALIAAGLTSCDTDNIGAIYEPTVANISFLAPGQSSLTDKSTIEVPVAIGRAITDGSYTANVSLSGNPSNMALKSNQVTFAPGEGIAYATIVVNGMEPGNAYTCTVNLSDADKATANLDFGQQMTSTVVEVMCDYNWVPAGTCTFVDYTFGDGVAAEGVEIEHADGSNLYRIVAPYTYTYPEDNAPRYDINFTLNSDGSISMQEGDWFNLWGYGFYYDTPSWGNYCYVLNEGNVYDVNFLLKEGGEVSYTAEFVFQWNR